MDFYTKIPLSVKRITSCLWLMFFFTANGFTQPSNNTCSGAIQIAVQNTGSCTPSGGYSTVGATNSLSNACMNGAFRDTWYKFTPTTSAVVLEGIGFWTVCRIELFDGCGGNSLECYAWPNTFSITWHGLTVNHTYYFRIGTLPSHGEGNIDLCLRSLSPLNDECNNAITLPVNNGNGNCDLSGSYSVVGATSSTSNACMDNQYNDTWYKFTVPSGMNEVSLEFVNLWSSNNKIEVFDVCGGSSIFCDFVEDYVPLAIPGLTPGQEYWLRIGTQITNISQEEVILLCLWGEASPPTNDECANATSLPMNSDDCMPMPYPMAGATISNNNAPCSGGSFPDIWFQTTSTESEFYIQSGIVGGIDYYLLSVYTDGCSTSNMVFCSWLNQNETYTIQQPAGNYTIRIESFQTGNIELCVWESTVLPIELISFQAQPQNNSIRLIWLTVSEIQNSHFEVEHSSDDLLFKELATIPGNGTTSEPKSYEFLHKNPQPGNHYYRLKQVDFDGTSTYSNIVSVRIAEKGAEKIRIFPNPTTGEVMIQGHGWERIVILNTVGKTEKEVSNPDSRLTINDLPEGVYLFQVWMKNGQINTERVVKTK